MSVTKHYRATIQKLKKRISQLERKEELGRKKLQRALIEARKLGKSYKSALHAKVRHIKGQMILDTAAAYGRAALEFERKMLKAAEKKGRALANAVVKMDKEAISKLVRDIAGKARKGKAAVKSKKKVKSKH